MSQTKRRYLSWQDVQQASSNRQETLSGTTVTKTEDQTISYFITSIIGTTVTLADKDGTTVLITSTVSFNYPIRIDGGFISSSSGAHYITFFTV